MDEPAWSTERFEEHRARLRLSRTDTSGIENLAAWLTTVVARVCLNMLRSCE